MKKFRLYNSSGWKLVVYYEHWLVYVLFMEYFSGHRVPAFTVYPNSDGSQGQTIAFDCLTAGSAQMLYTYLNDNL